ncbi:MAG TPA: P1 family peptidase, partial [Candidatus Sulfotelmatobacter sp.]|nr:P1 family peptidase [Candidatus Sulfotelmatobacter sp.]
MHRFILLLIFGVLMPPAPRAQNPASPAEHRPRARELAIRPGIYDPGTKNAITDVAGVLVGQVTISQGENVRTGVTAILPH